MLPKRLFFVTKTFGLCYINYNVTKTFGLYYINYNVTKTFGLCYINYIMLPKRLNYVISTILCYQNVWIMLPKRLNYVTKTFGLCYQNV